MLEETLSKTDPNVAAICITIVIVAWFVWMYKINDN